MIPDYAKPILEADATAYIKRLAGWPYAGMAVASDRWAQRKYNFAKEIWSKRNEPCPGFNMTWAERFLEAWHEPLVEYRTRLHLAREQESSAA